MHFKRVATGHSPFTAKHTQGSVNSSPSDTHIFLWPSNTSGWQVHTEYLKNDTSTCTKEKSQVIKVTGVLTCHMKWSSDYDRGILWSALLINYLSRNCPNKCVFQLLQCFCISLSEEAFSICDPCDPIQTFSPALALFGCRHMLMRLCLKDCQAVQIRRWMGNSLCQPAGQNLKGIPCRLECVTGRQFALDCQKPLVSLIYLLDLGFSLVFWRNETDKASWFQVIYV